MSQYAVNFINKLINADKAEVTKLLQRGLSAEVFPDSYKDIVQFCLDYQIKYGAIPSLLTVSDRFGVTADALTPDTPREPLAALYDGVLDDGIRASLATFSEAMGAKYNDSQTSGPELLTFLSRELQTINSKYSRTTGTIKSFSALTVDLKADYESILNGTASGIPIPFLFIQEEMNGWQESEITTVAAKTGVGKTWFLLLCAAAAAMGDPYLFGVPPDKLPHTAAQKQHARARTLIVSFEMPVIAIARRLAAILTGTSYRRLKSGKLSEAELQTYLHKLQEFATSADGTTSIGDSIRIVGPNTCGTPDQIHAQAEDFGADLVCVDGFYYMNGPGEKRWEKVESNMREMRLHTLMSTRHYLLATQLKKEATSLRSSTSDELSFSSSIAQDSNNIVLLVQTEQQKPTKQINVKLGKLRDGQAEKPYRYKWNFDTMEFSEVGEEAVSILGNTQNIY